MILTLVFVCSAQEKRAKLAELLALKREIEEAEQKKRAETERQIREILLLRRQQELQEEIRMKQAEHAQRAVEAAVEAARSPPVPPAVSTKASTSGWEPSPSSDHHFVMSAQATSFSPQVHPIASHSSSSSSTWAPPAQPLDVHSARQLEQKPGWLTRWGNAISDMANFSSAVSGTRVRSTPKSLANSHGLM